MRRWKRNRPVRPPEAEDQHSLDFECVARRALSVIGVRQEREGEWYVIESGSTVPQRVCRVGGRGSRGCRLYSVDAHRGPRSAGWARRAVHCGDDTHRASAGAAGHACAATHAAATALAGAPKHAVCSAAPGKCDAAAVRRCAGRPSCSRIACNSAAGLSRRRRAGHTADPCRSRRTTGRDRIPCAG